MAQSDGRIVEERSGETALATPSASQRETMRGIAHDLNGALNNLALNVELLVQTAAPDEGAGHDAASRARYVANLRRAIRAIQEIIEQQILPIGKTEEPDPGSRS